MTGDPVTLPEWLAVGYAHAVGLCAPDAPDPAEHLARAGVPRAEIEAEALRLGDVEGRCVMSATRRAFLLRALARMG